MRVTFSAVAPLVALASAFAAAPLACSSSSGGTAAAGPVGTAGASGAAAAGAGGGAGSAAGGAAGGAGGPSGPFQPKGCGFSIAPRMEYLEFGPGQPQSADAPAFRRVRLGLGGNVAVGTEGHADPARTIAVAWETDEGTLASDLAFGASPDPSTWVATDRASGVTWQTPASKLGSGVAERVHEAYACGLTPDTTYYYRVGGGVAGKEAWSDVYSFHTTPSDPKTTVQIAITGDSRGEIANAWQLSQERILKKGPTLQIFSGDMAVLANDQTEWEKWLDLGGKDSAGKPSALPQLLTLATHGNHENHGTMFFSSVTLPQDVAKYPNWAELFYSVDVGPAHIVVLDDYFIGTTPNPDYQAALSEWLEADLSAADKNRVAVPWVIVNHHHHEYSASTHGTDTDVLAVRSFLVPIWDKHHVDLSVTGHDHNYERSKPLTGPAASPTVHDASKDGTVYVVCAGVGADAYSAGMQPWLALSHDYKQAIGVYGMLTVSQTKLVVDGYLMTAAGDDPSIDHYEMTKLPSGARTRRHRIVFGPMIPTGAHVPVTRVSHSATSLGDLFRRRARATPQAPAVYENEGGVWRPTTWEGFHDRARRAAAGLASLGLDRGDRIAILGPTRSPWAVLDMAAQLVTAVSFGIYPQQTPEQIRYLLEHSEAKIVYVDGAAEIESVLAAARDLPSVKAIIPWTVELFEAVKTRDPRVVTPGVLAAAPMSDAEIELRASAVSPDDTAILIYTSGTTGPPKGAKIAHRNIIALLRAQEHLTASFSSDLSLNFLPMAHAAERIFGFFARIDTGIPTAYARSMGSVLEDLADVKPTLFGAVPRIFEKAYGKIQAELERKPPAVRKLFAWAVSVGRRVTELELAGKRVPRRLRLQRAIADKLVFQRVRAAFGGRVRYFVTGAAPIARAILEFFWAAGLPIYEVYGMTEATVVTHANFPGSTRLGTVGRVIAPMEAKIAADGEILMRGPWVFQGYLKAEAATAEMLEGGWLHTGDIGEIDPDGFLRITDRKKHLIITAGGKNLAPANIENALKNEDPLISQVYAHGDRRAYVIALIAPSPLETLSWGEERGVVGKDEVRALTRELMENPAARSPALNAAMARVVAAPELATRLRAAVKRGNGNLAHVEQVRRFAVIGRDFSQEMGELTPTMKLKRKAVEQIHTALIDAVYDGGGTEV